MCDREVAFIRKFLLPENIETEESEYKEVLILEQFKATIVNLIPLLLLLKTLIKTLYVILVNLVSGISILVLSAVSSLYDYDVYLYILQAVPNFKSIRLTTRDLPVASIMVYHRKPYYSVNSPRLVKDIIFGEAHETSRNTAIMSFRKIARNFTEVKGAYDNFNSKDEIWRVARLHTIPFNKPSPKYRDIMQYNTGF
ncbi:hypothetical protein BDF21DRAFT_448288 [Thamnidium elegans]|nr:hypothetical protein BDF21DRAFT_448288 [Thamnidium elegans]